MTNANAPALLSLVIPCYNESDRIGLLFSGLSSFKQKWKGPFEVIIVNDGSKDNFEQLVLTNEFYLQNKDMVTLISQENMGKGGALRTGVLKAKGKYILTLDADMSTPPEELIRWYAKWGGAPADNTIYTGSREHKDSVIKKKNNRKVVGNIFNVMVRVLTPLNMRDTQCGFKLYPAAEAKKIFDSLKTFGWAHDVEILYKAHLDKVNIIEMPLDWNAVDGSKINVIRDGMKMIVEILSIVTRIRTERAKK
ncbi:MAG: glycosyltransferase group 2 [Flavipsychrobacter sp.]|nr:glycosyltransferase group 2 [Flavipsychrobacter sp.]